MCGHAVHFDVWSSKISIPELKSLLLTADAFEQNVYKSLFEAVIWRSALTLTVDGYTLPSTGDIMAYATEL